MISIALAKIKAIAHIFGSIHLLCSYLLLWIQSLFLLRAKLYDSQIFLLAMNSHYNYGMDDYQAKTGFTIDLLCMLGYNINTIG